MSARILTEEQAADMVPGITARTLRSLRYAGGGPVFSKPTPKTVVYLEDDVLAWVRENRHTRTDKRVNQ